MKKTLGILKYVFWILLVAALILFNGAIYTVGESEVAVVRTFGEIKRVHVYSEDYIETAKKDLQAFNINADVVVGKGMNFKLPLISTVEKYSTKLLTYTSVPEEINTKDRRKIVIQLYAQYNIVNPGIVSIRTGGDYLSKLNILLDDKIYPIVIKTANGLNFSEFFDTEITNLRIDNKKDEFNKIMVSSYGVEIADTGMYKRSVPESNFAAIESKMIAEIDKTLVSLRTTADKDYNNRVRVADTAYTKTINEARSEAATIKSNADKKSLGMVQQAIKVDADFYRFIKRMELLGQIKNSPVILDSETNIFNDIKQ